MEDEKDQKIRELNSCIRAFKKYDAERSKFLNKMQLELEDYSERYLYLKNLHEGEDMPEIMRNKILGLKVNLKAQSKKVESLTRQLEMMKNPELLERAEFAIEHYDPAKLKEENDSLKKEIERHRKTNSELVYKICMLRKRIEELENQKENGNGGEEDAPVSTNQF